jgi:O-antigen ligase
LVFLFSPFITAYFNTDQLVFGNEVLPAESLYDAGSILISQCLAIIPFILGRNILRNPTDTREVLRALVVAGLLYSLPILFEVRMSPQLNIWIYGYFPLSWIQVLRDGGFRPVVFLGHGLIVALFVATTVVAAGAFWRTGTWLLRLPTAGIAAYFAVLLVLCKSLGALIYGTVLLPLVRFTRPLIQMRVALLLVSITLAYPMLRSADLVPTQFILNTARMISTDRASSLETRFTQEHKLLNRASQRFLFGWGRWGRHRIHDEYSGRDTSLTDGRWIITLGQFGLVGFLAQFGLLAWPVFRAASAFRFVKSLDERVYLAALTLIVAISVFDLLPNSFLSPWTWLLVGSLLGRAEALSVAERERKKLQPNPDFATVRPLS